MTARAEAFATIRAVVTAVGEVPPPVAERLDAVERIFTGREPPSETGKVRRLRASARDTAA